MSNDVGEMGIKNISYYILCHGLHQAAIGMAFEMPGS
jgi:hypothetical protein